MHPQILVLLSSASALVSVPFQKKSSISKRDASSVGLHGFGLGFNINFTIGGQQFEGTLDTGSSDIWVPSSSGCTKDSKEGVDCQYTFNSGDSSNYVQNSSSTIGFNIAYGDGSSANGSYAQDTIEVGSITLTGANFALATEASANPVFGIGPAAGEVSYYQYYTADQDTLEISNTDGDLYRNFPLQLKDAGIISSAAYSLWLNNPNSYEGNIVFGGVDYAKVNGSLYTVPIEYEPVSYSTNGSAVTLPDITRFLVMVDKIKIYTEGGSQRLMRGPFPALLDSGSTVSSMPSQLASAIYEIFGADSESGLMGCGFPDGDIGITIRGQEFLIPFSVFVRTLYNYEGDELVLPNGDVVCTPGVQPDDDSLFMIFGDSVLEALYVVYDLDAEEISIGQALFDVTDEKLEEISSGVPSATKAPYYSHTYSTYDLGIANEVSVSVSASLIKSVSGDKATRTTVRTDSAASVAIASSSGHSGASASATGTSASRSGSHSSSNAANIYLPAMGGVTAALFALF